MSKQHEGVLLLMSLTVKNEDEMKTWKREINR